VVPRTDEGLAELSNPSGSAVRGTIGRSRRARWQTVGAGAILTASTIFVAISLATARSGSTANDLGSAIGQSVPALMLALVGVILVVRLPGHAIGWLLAVGGLAIALNEGASGLADYGLNAHPGSVPGAIWFAWLGELTWVPEIACLFILLPLLYPTGRLPSARWQVVLVIAGALVVIGGVSGAFVSWAPAPYPLGNPLALGGPPGALVSFLNYVVATVLVLAGGALAIASLIVRYRRAAPIERQQLKWFAAVAIFTGLGGATNIVTSSPEAGAPTGALATVNAVSGLMIYGGLALLPVAIGIAVLRYRLFEIDRLISRTIAYAVVSAILAGVFVGVVLAVQAVMGSVTGSSTIAVAGSTLIVFALFAPIRRRVQRLVDRRFNRSRYDAERTVLAFAARLRDEVDLEQLRAEILATVAQAVEPSSVSLWLRE
jgi:hypothetical protein